MYMKAYGRDAILANVYSLHGKAECIGKSTAAMPDFLMSKACMAKLDV